MATSGVELHRLDIQIVTKRLPNVVKRLAAIGATTWPRHVGLMATMCNQDEADRDVPGLLALKSELQIPWVGVSAEPMLGAINFRRICLGSPSEATFPANSEIKAVQIIVDALVGAESLGWSPIDQIIVGGKSGPHARDNDFLANARAIRDQCAAAGVAFFGKQGVKKVRLPDDLNIHEFPSTIN